MNPILDLRSLSRPTEEQYAAFAEHVGEAHSWYKHLPLLTGGQFVVFLAPDAGIGRLVARLTETGYELVTPAEGSVFTDANPRLHYSWKTSAEYRERFGYLDYAYRTRADGTFGRDVGGPMHLPAEVWDRCSFTLFPYVSDGTGPDAIRWAHEEAVQELRAGAHHPRREAVLEWARLAQERDERWGNLTEEEREMSLADDRKSDGQREQTTPALDEYHATEAELHEVYYEQLRPDEVAKIGRALGELRAWLDGR